MDEGLRFAIREGGRTVGAGVVAKIGIIGKKLGMTQIFNEQGQQMPVTVIEAEPNPVTKVVDKAAAGFAAVELGYGRSAPRARARRASARRAGAARPGPRSATPRRRGSTTRRACCAASAWTTRRQERRGADVRGRGRRWASTSSPPASA
jgi:ribosomal protein L3